MGHCSGGLHGGESRRITKNGRRRAGDDGCASILFAFNVASNRVGRNDRLGGGFERKESSEKERGQEVGGSQ